MKNIDAKVGEYFFVEDEGYYLVLKTEYVVLTDTMGEPHVAIWRLCYNRGRLKYSHHLIS